MYIFLLVYIINIYVTFTLVIFSDIFILRSYLTRFFVHMFLCFSRLQICTDDCFYSSIFSENL